jgi:hypothetical protein
MVNALQFRIELLGVDPPVWRRILVPEDYSLWGLHVAIQDAMGWLDYHLHAFRVVGSQSTYGIPDEDGDDLDEVFPDWDVQARDVFNDADPIGMYEYDFGDSWIHLIVFEDYANYEATESLPRCIGGGRRCPPEDCGGPGGYAEFLDAIRDPSHPEHGSMLEWAGGRFDPEEFDIASVRFDDPDERWRRAFADDQD